jgi:hypothetical protein
MGAGSAVVRADRLALDSMWGGYHKYFSTSGDICKIQHIVSKSLSKSVSHWIPIKLTTRWK